MFRLKFFFRYLGKRITTRNTLIEDHNSNVESFRARLVELEKENIILREENSRLKGGSDGDRRRIDLLEKKVVNAENANIALTRKNAALEEVKIQLERELDDKELVINANKKQQDRYVNVNNSYKRSKVVGGHFRGVEINCRGGKYFKS